VNYREEEIKVRQESCLARARDYIRRPDVSKALSQATLRKELVVGMHALISYELLWNTLQFKHHAYSEECEARVLLTGDAPNVSSSTIHKTRVRKNELVSYIQLPFAPSIRSSGRLQRVIVGPAASNETFLSAKAFLRSAGFSGVEVRKCDIPYRATRSERS
jgi:hypothetical protein